MQLSFGSGAVWGERTDLQIGTTGGNGARPFGVLQDISVDAGFSDKLLYGQYQWPVAIARGSGKITGKARFARILGLMYSDLFWGLQATQNQLTAAQNEAQTVPSSPGPCTITVANAANYNDDLGATTRPAAPMPASAPPRVCFSASPRRARRANTRSISRPVSTRLPRPMPPHRC